MTKRLVRFWRRWRASWRDTMLLLRDFRIPLLLFALVVVGGGLVYYYLYQSAPEPEPLASLAEAIYLILTMVVFQAGGSFPQTWYLQIFYFVMPVVGLSILAQGLTDFGVLLFNRRARSREWEMAVASTFSNHTILVGMGHLGFRVVQKMRELDQEVVVIEQEPREDLALQLQALDVPLLQGDGTREALLRAAGVDKARTLILCTQNDNLNLQIAVKARSINPHLKVVIRIFDDDFARALEQQFGFTAISATGMAAPVFAAIAAGMDISHPITVEGESLCLARLTLSAPSRLTRLSVADVEREYGVSVVLVRNKDDKAFHPEGERQLTAGDTIAVLAGPEQINRLAQDNH